MGAYRDDDGKPYILGCVKKACKIILDKNMDNEYAGIQGIDSYINNSIKLAYGEDNDHLKNGHIVGA